MSLELALDIQHASTSEWLPTDEQFALWVTTAIGNSMDEAELTIRIVDLSLIHI